MAQDLPKYALRREIPYIGEDGKIHYRTALSWAKLGSNGIIIADAKDIPREGGIYPPLEVIEGDTVYNAWIAEMEKFVLYPHYDIEEVGDNWVLVTRADGVRFKVIHWLCKTVLLELTNYPEGARLDEFLPVVIARMAEHRPEYFEENTDKKIAKAADIVIDAVGILYMELGLIRVEKLQ